MFVYFVYSTVKEAMELGLIVDGIWTDIHAFLERKEAKTALNKNFAQVVVDCLKKNLQF
jgi:hypothetical protein